MRGSSLMDLAVMLGASVLDVAGTGKVVLNGNQFTAISNYVFTGKITANGGMLVTRNYWQDLANFSSNYFSNINVGMYARQWYNTVSADPNTLPLDMFVASQDASPSALSFSNRASI